MLPSTRAVNGVPDASCSVPLTCQSPNSDAALPLVNHDLFAPNGSS